LAGVTGYFGRGDVSLWPVEGVLAGLAENIEKTPGKPATTAFAIEKTFDAFFKESRQCYSW